MADVPRTSFIPKQNSAKQKMPAPKRKRTFNVFNFFVFVVFLAAVIAAGLVFLWESRAQTQLNQSEARLSELKSTFSISDIQSLRELDHRINVADGILRNHLSPSLVFDMLERRTQGEVQFTSFLYQRNESGNVALMLNGIAPRFNTIALQSQEFVEESIIERAFFTNMDIVFRDQETGEGERVRFRVTSSVDTDVIPYEATALPAPALNETTEVVETTDATSTDEVTEGDTDSIDDTADAETSDNQNETP